MKVSEARLKVCPFISNCVGTATDAGEYLIYCMTDSCMAWKYSHTRSDVKFEMVTQKQNDGTTIQQRKYIELKEDDKKGYCTRLNTPQ